MSGNLTLNITSEDNGSCELTAEFQAYGYAAIGSAWFQKSFLHSHAESFADYPINRDEYPRIRGGYWNKLATEIEEEHLYIAAYPIGERGELALYVRCAMPRDSVDRTGLRCGGFVELKADYEQLRKFSIDIEHLLNGDISKVVFSE